MKNIQPTNTVINLPENEVHIWSMHSSSSHPATDESCLSPAEQQQARRFLSKQDQTRYLLTRIFLRHTLSRYQTVAPKEWQFAIHSHGRPFIAAPPLHLPLYFNLTHTSGLLALAIARFEAIGIDAEWLGRKNAVLNIAQRRFTPQEYQTLIQLEPKQRMTRFLQYWTLKEAYLKAIGTGMTQSLNSIEFSFSSLGKVQAKTRGSKK